MWGGGLGYDIRQVRLYHDKIHKTFGGVNKEVAFNLTVCIFVNRATSKFYNVNIAL
jgi:hypothetical protein